MIQSPLNYTGGKYKLLPQILPLFPQGIRTFVDLFCGGCNVGINVQADSFVYNDHCTPLVNLYSVMRRMDPQEFIRAIENVIDKYGLSDVKAHGYSFYGCNSADGLSEYNRKHYLALRNDFNASIDHNDEYYIQLYVLTPLYKFFYKKISYRNFLMYNKFTTTITKESDLYDKLIIQQQKPNW